MEGLGHVIVTAHIEADQAVRFIVLGRQEDNGNITELADTAADLEAIHAGHHQIEEHNLRFLVAQRMQRGHAIVGNIDDELFLLKIRF